jgi:hypothetical protein
MRGWHACPARASDEALTPGSSDAYLIVSNLAAAGGAGQGRLEKTAAEGLVDCGPLAADAPQAPWLYLHLQPLSVEVQVPVEQYR